MRTSATLSVDRQQSSQSTQLLLQLSIAGVTDNVPVNLESLQSKAVCSTTGSTDQRQTGNKPAEAAWLLSGLLWVA